MTVTHTFVSFTQFGTADWEVCSVFRPKGEGQVLGRGGVVQCHVLVHEFTGLVGIAPNTRASHPLQQTP